MSTPKSTDAPLVLVGAQNGVTVIPSPTALTRLNYFDGKFLRADDLRREQEYLRALVQLSNQGLAPGVVQGLDTRLGTGDTLEIDPGLAVDSAGRTIFLPQAASVGIAALVDAARNGASGGSGTNGSGTKDAAGAGKAAFSECEEAASTPPGSTAGGTDYWLVTIGQAEALCGQEDVYGQVCDDACAGGTDRPYRLEGAIVRLVPWPLAPAACTMPGLDRRHLRSLYASAYYADERARLGRTMSAARLRLDVWCLGAHPDGGGDVPLGVLARSGGATAFFDAWTARRERTDAPGRRYWQWQMMMRPWDVFIAQVLQFQCQLHEVLGRDPGSAGGGDDDPCGGRLKVLKQASAFLDEIHRAVKGDGGDAGKVREKTASSGMAEYDFAPDYAVRLAELKESVAAELKRADVDTRQRILVNGGIVELPPAGYLPVVPGPVDVNTQVRRLMGEGVDLRFCSVRPDYVGHALEEAQHLDRICLLAGIADPAQKQEVDVLVPDGRVLDGRQAPAGRWYAVDLRLIPPDLSGGDPTEGQVIEQPAEPSAPAPSAPTAPAPTAPQSGFTEKAVAEKDAATGAAADFVEAPSQGGEMQYPVGEPHIVMPSYGSFAPEPAAVPRFRGAGRSERKESGAAAFYFAGVSAAPSERILARFTDANRAAMKTYDTAKTSGAKSSYEKAAGDDTPDPLGMRDLDRRMTEFQSAARKKGAETMLEDAPTGAFIGLWVHLHVAADPFALASGETAAFGVDAAAAATLHRSPVAAELSLNGTLVAVSSHASATGARVTGRATGWVEVEGRAHGHTGKPHSARLAVKAELVLEAKPDASALLDLKLTLPNGYVVDVATRWRGDPVSAVMEVKVDLAGILRAVYGSVSAKQKPGVKALMAAVARRSDQHHVEVARATALESADVYQPANRQHVAAVAALKAIEKGLAQPGFRDMAERLLFPPPQQREEGARIEATRDWVLFHRRRGSSCDCGCGAPPALAARRYRVIEARVHGIDSVAELRRYLESGREVPAKDLRPVTFVEFPGGSSHLSTPDAAIEEAWRLSWRKGSRLVLGAVAGQGAGADDPDALAVERLERVAHVVAEITPQAADAEFIPLPMVPAWLDADGADGVMLLVTRSATTCLEVWEARGADDSGAPLPGDRVLEEIRELAEGESLMDRLKRVGRPIGTVTFDAGTTQDASGLPEVQGAWKSLGLDVPEAGLVVAPGSATARALLAKQGQTVARGLGAEGITVDSVADKEQLTSCAGILFLAPRQKVATTCMEVYRVRQSMTVDSVLNAMQRGAWYKDSTLFAVHLATATFRGAALDSDGGLPGAWTANGGGGVAKAVVVSTDTDATAVHELVVDGILLTKLLPGGGTADHATVADNPAPGGSCGSVLLLQADQAPPADTCHEVYLVAQSPGGSARTLADNVIKTAGLSHFLDLCDRVGTATFPPNGTGPEAQTPTLQVQWFNAGGGSVGDYWVIAAGNPSEDEQQFLGLQAQGIVAEVGSTTRPPSDPILVSSVPSPCGTLTIIENLRQILR